MQTQWNEDFSRLQNLINKIANLFLTSFIYTMEVKFQNYNTQSLYKTPMIFDKSKGAASLRPQKQFSSSRDLFFNNSYRPSFGIREKELEGYDLACAKKFKPEIEKFKTKEDFNNWAKEELKEKFKLDNYENDIPEVEKAVRQQLREWKIYLEEDFLYKNSPALSLIIFDSITNELSEKNQKIPPLLHKGVLADTISQLKKMSSSTSGNFNFKKMYDKNLRLEYTKNEVKEAKEISEAAEDNKKTCVWIRIPSKTNDNKNFKKNVERLQALSHDSWCTRSSHAEQYLAEGDFCVYLENNKPKVGIRFERDRIEEIEGEKNDHKIPLKYLDEIKTYIQENGFTGAKRQLEIAEEKKKYIDAFKSKHIEDFKGKNYVPILADLGFIVKLDENGLIELSHYEQPVRFDFEDIGIDENELFKKISKIKGSINFKDTNITNLGALKIIGGNAQFEQSKLVNLGNLEVIKGGAYFTHSKVEDLGNLQEIGGYANFGTSNVSSLGNLRIIGGGALFKNSPIGSLSNLQYIGGDADFEDCHFRALGKLKEIGGCASFSDSEIDDLGDLETIGEEAKFNNSSVTNLGKLKSIGGWAYFNDSLIRDLGNLEYIGKSAVFDSNYKKIKGNVEIKDDVCVYPPNSGEYTIVDKADVPFLKAA